VVPRGRRAGWQAGLVVPGGVQDEVANELAAVAIDDPDVQVVDQQQAGLPPRPMWCSRLLWRRVTEP
jgi:hypothetical protein